MRWFSTALLIYISIEGFQCKGLNFFPKIEPKYAYRDVGEPLILTPYLEDGKIDEARALAEVDPTVFKNVESYSGFFTVDKAFDSNLFFWFFPAEINFEDAPVLLWLQGGPGASSLYALFEENGPIQINTDGTVGLREYTWSKNHSVIYIDNPVGTGFSFTNNGFSQNQTKVGEHLYSALLQFFQLFPELQDNDFVVTGESYAGKYIPSVSYTIHKNNPTAEQKINLKGLAIGNGLCDPVNQMLYGDYLYQLGLIDSNTREEFEDYEAQIKEAVAAKDFKKAFELFDLLLNGDLTPVNSLFKNATGFSNYFNYLYPEEPAIYGDFSSFVQSEAIREVIHVGNLTYNSGVEVEQNLLEDVMDSIAPWLTELINNYRVLIYNGQLDIIVAYPLTVNYLKTLKFDGQDEYKTAERKIWYIDDDVAGYGKTAGNLTEMMIRNAGHMVPGDQPLWGYELIHSFVRDSLLKN